MWVQCNCREVIYREDVRKEAESKRYDVRKTQSAIAGFEVGRRLQAKEGGQILEMEKTRKGNLL